jgi:hypothetical protein
MEKGSVLECLRCYNRKCGGSGVVNEQDLFVALTLHNHPTVCEKIKKCKFINSIKTGSLSLANTGFQGLVKYRAHNFVGTILNQSKKILLN